MTHAHSHAPSPPVLVASLSAPDTDSAALVRGELRAAAATRPKPVAKALVAVRKPAPKPVTRVVARPRKVVRAVAAPKVTAAPKVQAVHRVETYLERGQRVLASLHYPYQRLGYTIAFLPDKQGYLGLTDGGRKLISIYVRSSESDLVLAHSIAHEIGHALDFARGGPATRSLYLSIRGLSPALTWFGCSGCTDYQTPAGDWAEVFANWLAGPGDFRSRVAGAPSAAQLTRLSALFAA